MIYLEGLMHKKINIFAALLAIIIITVLAAWAISAKAVSGAKGSPTGLLIGSIPIKCVPDPHPDESTCLVSCPICGNLPKCASLYEVKAGLIGGKNVLYKSKALCLTRPTPTRGGTFHPGSKCLGNVLGRGPHTLTTFGCTR